MHDSGCSSVVERRAGGPDVVGSIPITPTKDTDYGTSSNPDESWTLIS